MNMLVSTRRDCRHTLSSGGKAVLNNYHIKLHVGNLDCWVKFFTTNMGFELMGVGKSAVLLSNGHIRLKLQEITQKPAKL